MMDIRTKNEKEREAKHKAICNMFSNYSKDMPECAPHRLFRIIAEQFDMTVPGVKNIIVKQGLYKTNS